MPWVADGRASWCLNTTYAISRQELPHEAAAMIVIGQSPRAHISPSLNRMHVHIHIGDRPAAPGMSFWSHYFLNVNAAKWSRINRYHVAHAARLLKRFSIRGSAAFSFDRWWKKISPRRALFTSRFTAIEFSSVSWHGCLKKVRADGRRHWLCFSGVIILPVSRDAE